MRAEYDSRADALSIGLVEVEEWDYDDDQDLCTVAFAAAEPVNVELLSPAENLGLLAVAAGRHGLDRDALEAAARSALAAPDRVVVLEVGERALA